MTLPQAVRRLAVRAAFALLLYTQPRTPFCRCAAFPLKGKQEMVPLTLAPLETARAQSTAEPCAPLRGRGPRSGAGVLYGKNRKWHPPKAGRPRSEQPLRIISTRSLVHPFAAARHFPSRGNKRLCRYPLRPEMARTENAAEPCAPFRGRGPRSGAGVYYAENFNEQPSLKYSYHIFL